MKRFSIFLKNIQQEAYCFLFFSFLLTLFRGIFLAIYASQIEANALNQIPEALLLGLRLSFKTVGYICLTGIVFSLIPNLFYSKWPAFRIRRYWYSAITFFLTILYAIQVAYYGIFNNNFNIMVLNGTQDDGSAILQTAIHQYGLIPRTIIGIIAAAILIYLFQYIFRLPLSPWQPKTKRSLTLSTAASIIILAILFVFFRYGGAFSYKNSVTWENAARLQSHVLNEAILDGPQGLYRVWSIHNRIESSTKITFTANQLRQMIKATGGNTQASTIDAAYQHTITKTYLPKAPTTVAFILGESYGLWPFLPEFNHPGQYIAQEGRALAQAPNSIETKDLLAQGTGTMPAVNGFLTGLPDVNLYPNYIPTKAPYGMGIGSVMKNLGYKTVFWYGGFGSWQNIKNFALSQDFDEYHDATDFSYTNGNAWGAPDAALFDAIEKYLAKHKNEKIFLFILTTSNHPPYDLPLSQYGYDSNKARNQLPDSIANTDKQVNEMGHYWYADQSLGHFVHHVEKTDPSSLFIITGDHSERFTFAKDVSTETRSAIPAIFYGQGIQKDWMPKNQYGTAIQIIPTIAELVGRPGQTYDAIFPSLLSHYPFAFNHRLWINSKGLFSEKDMPAAYQKLMKDYRNIALWRIKNGNSL